MLDSARPVAARVTPDRGAQMTIAIPRLDRSTAAERGLTIADFLVPIRVGERLNARVRDIAPDRRRRAVHLPHRARSSSRTDRQCPCTGQTFGVLLVGGALGLPPRAARRSRCTSCSAASACRSSPRARAGSSVILGRDRRLPDRVRRRRRGRRPAGRARLGPPHRWRARRDADRQRDDLRDRPAVAGRRRRHLHAGETIAAGLTPFLLWDALKLAVAAGIFPVAWWVVGRRPDDR